MLWASAMGTSRAKGERNLSMKMSSAILSFGFSLLFFLNNSPECSQWSFHPPLSRLAPSYQNKPMKTSLKANEKLLGGKKKNIEKCLFL